MSDFPAVRQKPSGDKHIYRIKVSAGQRKFAGKEKVDKKVCQVYDSFTFPERSVPAIISG